VVHPRVLPGLQFAIGAQSSPSPLGIVVECSGRKCSTSSHPHCLYVTKWGKSRESLTIHAKNSLLFPGTCCGFLLAAARAQGYPAASSSRMLRCASRSSGSLPHQCAVDFREPRVQTDFAASRHQPSRVELLGVQPSASIGTQFVLPVSGFRLFKLEFRQGDVPRHLSILIETLGHHPAQVLRDL
jgi:hypothetical protein